MSAPFLISLRPRFADLVFNGLKLAELRRRFAADAEGRDVYVYVTSPQMVLRGGFRVDQVWRGPPEQVWQDVRKLAAIQRPDFDAYFEGSITACALGITEVWAFQEPVCLPTLKDRLDGFVVPQSWRYVKPKEVVAFEAMREKVQSSALASEGTGGAHIA